MSLEQLGAPLETAAPVLAPTCSTARVLRFRVDQHQAESLLGAALFSQHARNRGVVRRLDTAYFDTPDRFLFGQNLSLRVRRHGRRFVQRLALHDRAGIAAPMLWEWLLDDATPDLACLSAARIDGLKRPLGERLAQSPMGPVFETRLRRHIRRLDMPDATMDVVIDEGSVQAGRTLESLHEIGLVLQAGEPACLYDFGTRLLETGSLHLNPLGIVRRGYALASGKAMRALKAEPGSPTESAATLPTDDLIATILLDCQAHLLANQPIVEQGRNPDGVHQMRVALRRLRSALTLYHRELGAPSLKHFAEEAKWAATELGDARAWDVLLTSTIAEPQRLHRSGADFAHLARIAETPRQAGYGRARAMIDTARHDRFQLALSLWIARRGWRNEVDAARLASLAEPAAAMAARILARLHAKAVRQGKGVRHLSAGRRHDLRITLKKLRYASEFFLPLFDDTPTARRYGRQIGRLQEALGLDQDAATTQPLLDDLSARDTAPGLHQAIGVVAGWQAHALRPDSDALSGPWRRFKGQPVFWSNTHGRES